MKAALVTSFGSVPQWSDVPDPHATAPHETVIDVLAAGLHPRVRSQADGSHYTSTDELPLVPGVDGVGRDRDGTLRYFVLPDTALGSMAERTVIDVRRSVPLPDDADPVAVAAGMNPAMSSWVGLRRRVSLTAGGGVAVLGATGNAGRMALQVARLLGAGDVVAVVRDAGRAGALSGLGADAVVGLDDPVALGRAASEVDVVLDYLWGEPAAAAMRAIVPARSDDQRTLNWLQIGSVAGPECPVPSAALRATRLSIVGSGQGSVSTAAIVAELPVLADRILDGSLTVDARAVPMRDVAENWSATAGQRIVLVA